MTIAKAVLESFDTERQRLNATLTAGRTGLTRAAARRQPLTLTHLGYLETDGSYFWFSSKVLRFSGSYLASARLSRALQPSLNRLAAQVQESFSVAALNALASHTRMSAAVMQRDLLPILLEAARELRPLL